MNKTYLIVISALFISFLATSCSNQEPSAENDNTIRPISPTVSAPIVNQPTTFDEYITLVEGYIEGESFKQMDENETKELSNMLLGHYDIIGRTAGNGMDYYLANRRSDAPVYKDFQNIDIRYFSESDKEDEILQIGYYDKASYSKILYEVHGYDILDLPLGNESLDSFCFGVERKSNESMNPAFNLAFTKSGRSKLDFIKRNTGLSLYSENIPCIEFYYQDDETLKFYSAPYPCYINISSDELEEIRIRGLLASRRVEENINSREEAWKFLHVKDKSIRTTGARLIIDDKSYELLGNKNIRGYMMCSTDEHEFISLEFNEALYNFVMTKIQDVVNIDYGSFDAKWFEIPLVSASIEFPERIEQTDGSYITDMRTQTVDDVDKLTALSELMSDAINSAEIYGFSGCPYDATIQFIREDGEILRIFVASDSCDSFAYEGRIGFDYGKQSDLASIFNEAMADRSTK